MDYRRYILHRAAGEIATVWRQCSEALLQLQVKSTSTVTSTLDALDGCDNRLRLALQRLRVLLEAEEDAYSDHTPYLIPADPAQHQNFLNAWQTIMQDPLWKTYLQAS
jgi:hypothetical protein